MRKNNIPVQKKSKQINVKQIAKVWTSANVKYMPGKPMLTADELRNVGSSCIELHNYYINNYRTKIDIMVQYKDCHFLHRNGMFPVSFGDL